MKKLILSIICAIMLIGFVSSCTDDNTSEDQTIYEQATDKDDTPSGGDKGGND